MYSLTFTIYPFFVYFLLIRIVTGYNETKNDSYTETTINTTISIFTETDTSLYHSDEHLVTDSGESTTPCNRSTGQDVRELSFDDVDKLLQCNTTRQFLETFNSDVERDIILHQLRYCPYVPLCTFSLNVTFWRTTCCGRCECDYPTCLITNTCCPDILFKYKNSSLIGPQMACLPLDIRAQESGAFGYDNCPPGVPEQLIDNCTRTYNASLLSLYEIIPAYDITTQTLYRNKYCAYCHNVRNSDIEFMELCLNCTNPKILKSESDIINAVFAEKSCKLTFVSTNNLTLCTTSISKCNETGSWKYYDDNIQKACNMYRSVISISIYERYQNPFCSSCNDKIPYDPICLMPASIHKPFSFSGLLKLGSENRNMAEDVGHNQCSRDQMYDVVTMSCKDLFCSEITQLHHGRCVDVFEQLSRITYISYLRLIPSQELGIEDAYNIADEIILQIIKNITVSIRDVCRLQLVYQTDAHRSVIDPISIRNSKLRYFDALVEIFENDPHSPYSVISKIHSLQRTPLTVKTIFFNISKPVSFRVLLRDDDSFIYDNISSIISSPEFYEGPYYGYEERVPLEKLISLRLLSKHHNFTIFPHVSKQGEERLCTTYTVKIDVIKIEECPHINISKQDVSWDVLDDGLLLNIGDIKLESDQFYFSDDNTISVCADRYTELLTDVFDSSLTAETIVSIVFTSCSILCLLLTFLIFCIFPVLRRSLPGKSTMSLSVALMFAQVLYLVGSVGGLDVGTTGCKIVGLFVHFLWLVALFWMNVCTFHIFRVLARTQVVSQQSGVKRIFLYHILTTIMAAVFVSINISVSYSTLGNFGYGETVCYISTQKMVIYTFCIPVAFVVISNLSMFTFVVVKIRKSPSVQKSVQNERNDLIVFTKLSTITGLTWIFGIFNIWLEHVVLSYLFIFLNAAHGAFIMFAFVVNSRVFELFKNRSFGLSTTTDTGTTRSTNSRNRTNV